MALNETLSAQELTELACIRYGQLVTPIEVYKFGDSEQEQLLKDVVEEYTQYIPMTKIINTTVTPEGVFLGNDIISVRNMRMDNFYFSKLSPRMNRRQRRFDAHTKKLYAPMSLPVIVECGAMYPYGRISVNTQMDTVLTGDPYVSFKLRNHKQGTLKVTIGKYSWNDATTQNLVILAQSGVTSSIVYDPVTQRVTISDIGQYTYYPDAYALAEDPNNPDNTATVVFDPVTQTLSVAGLKSLTLDGETPVIVSYNTNKPVVQGLGLRDKLFVDLYIGRLMLALGNIKSEVVMEGDIIGFNNSDLLSQGKELIDKTLELLMSSSTTYKVI